MWRRQECKSRTFLKFYLFIYKQFITIKSPKTNKINNPKMVEISEYRNKVFSGLFVANDITISIRTHKQ